MYGGVMCMCQCRCPQSPEESVRFPGVGATSSCEPPIQVLGWEMKVGPLQDQHVLPIWATSLALHHYSPKRTEVRKGWRDSSLVRSSCCSWKGPDFDSQHPCGSQLSTIPVPRDSMPFSYDGTRHTWFTCASDRLCQLTAQRGQSKSTMYFSA